MQALPQRQLCRPSVNERGCVPLKLYSQKQVVGGIPP